MISNDTIFALSSGAGMAGISVIRASGPRALAAAERMAGPLPESHHAVLRRFRHPESGDALDEGLLLIFRKPRSFTGEDVCEFHVHGSLAVQKALLEALGSLPGLRAAEAGEFTRRAVRNGRLDLIGAEGLADLIHARTERQRRQALHHTLGLASNVAEKWRKGLVTILGRIEAAVDFVDEPGVAEEARRSVRAPLAALIGDMREALSVSRQGAAVREGLKVVLAGPPNVGKSSLLNAIAKRDAAIVSAIPGTTRDVIEVNITLAGLPVILTDTAGLRALTGDEIEAAGMARTHRELGAADIVVWVTAADQGPRPPPKTDSAPIWIENKTDLPQEGCRTGPAYRVSAKTGAGMTDFIAALENRAKDISGTAESALLVRSRHQQAVQSCVRHLEEALDSPPQQIELAAEELRAAAHALGMLTGAIGVEDVLDAIFREFCIGK